MRFTSYAYRLSHEAFSQSIGQFLRGLEAQTIVVFAFEHTIRFNESSESPRPQRFFNGEGHLGLPILRPLVLVCVELYGRNPRKVAKSQIYLLRRIYAAERLRESWVLVLS